MFLWVHQLLFFIWNIVLTIKIFSFFGLSSGAGNIGVSSRSFLHSNAFLTQAGAFFVGEQFLWRQAWTGVLDPAQESSPSDAVDTSDKKEYSSSDPSSDAAGGSEGGRSDSGSASGSYFLEFGLGLLLPIIWKVSEMECAPLTCAPLTGPGWCTCALISILGAAKAVSELDATGKSNGGLESRFWDLCNGVGGLFSIEGLGGWDSKDCCSSTSSTCTSFVLSWIGSLCKFHRLSHHRNREMGLCPRTIF